MTRVLFKSLKIGDKFQKSHKNEGFSANYGPEAIMKYEKTSGTRAKCTEQIGYGNTRAVGGLYGFGSNSIVEII